MGATLVLLVFAVATVLILAKLIGNGTGDDKTANLTPDASGDSPGGAQNADNGDGDGGGGGDGGGD